MNLVVNSALKLFFFKHYMKSVEDRIVNTNLYDLIPVQLLWQVSGGDTLSLRLEEGSDTLTENHSW